MAGLRNIARMYGGMTINGVRWVWDYAADEAVLAEDMKPNTKRWKTSERAKWGKSPPTAPPDAQTDQSGGE